MGQLGNLTSDTSVVHNYFGRIITQVDEMSTMLIELLEVYKLVKLIPHKVVCIIEEVLYAFEPICTSKNIRLSLINNTDVRIHMSTRLFCLSACARNNKYVIVVSSQNGFMYRYLKREYFDAKVLEK